MWFKKRKVGAVETLEDKKQAFIDAARQQLDGLLHCRSIAEAGYVKIPVSDCLALEQILKLICDPRPGVQRYWHSFEGEGVKPDPEKAFVRNRLHNPSRSFEV